MKPDIYLEKIVVPATDKQPAKVEMQLQEDPEVRAILLTSKLPSELRAELREKLASICEKRGWMIRQVYASKKDARAILKPLSEHVGAMPPEKGWIWKRPPATTGA
uniref:Uncharacterized protein n=1 Tax=viral metagenome TaxID=1070528 RepID=A0A6H1Z8L3_9ZZZZ